MTARRLQVERFDRYQRQFARARAHRRLLEFRASLDELVTRASTRPTASPPPPPRAPSPGPTPVGKAAHDQAMRDLLVRVAARQPIPRSDPSGPYPPDAVFWSPSAFHGFRVWELWDGRWRGARQAWPEPHQTAVCLKTGTDPNLPVPHDVSECSHPPCGIYALKDPQMITAEQRWFGERAGTLLFGLTELTGRVVEHTRGYRAEHVKVVAAAVLSGNERSVQTAWVEGSTDLYLLFGSPAAALARHLGGRRPTTDALDEAPARLAQQAAMLRAADPRT